MVGRTIKPGDGRGRYGGIDRIGCGRANRKLNAVRRRDPSLSTSWNIAGDFLPVRAGVASTEDAAPRESGIEYRKRRWISNETRRISVPGWQSLSGAELCEGGTSIGTSIDPLVRGGDQYHLPRVETCGR